MLSGSVILPCGDRIHVLIATSTAELRNGLQGQSPSADEGMLFVYPIPQVLSFWMRGVHVPLDIIWLTQGARISQIVHRASPCMEPCLRYRSTVPAQYVLELQGGQAMVHGLRQGQIIRLLTILV